MILSLRSGGDGLRSFHICGFATDGKEAIGDTVKRDELIAEIESDKATIELSAPYCCLLGTSRSLGRAERIAVRMRCAVFTTRCIESLVRF